MSVLVDVQGSVFRATVPDPAFVDFIIRHGAIFGTTVDHPFPSGSADNKTTAVRANIKSLGAVIEEPACIPTGPDWSLIEHHLFACVRPAIDRPAKTLPFILILKWLSALFATSRPAWIIVRVIIPY